MKLNKKIIIVTGGSGLLGKEFVNFLKNENAIVINADATEPLHNKECFHYCDITDSNSVDSLIKFVLDKYGRIDGLVNNAYPRTKDWGTSFENVKEDSWRMNIDMQLNSYVFISRKVLLEMKKQAFGGSIVNLGSIYGFLGPDFTVYENTTMGNSAEYAAIKGGIINLTRYLASLYGKENIRVNTVSPGGVFDNQNEIFVNQYSKKVPLGRMATPLDIAPSIAFLLSDESKYITGQNLIIDGGWSIV
jgi:NAD(P)-dependent dehydrogenase (short-subunit alcohol dehydrogenase family)